MNIVVLSSTLGLLLSLTSIVHAEQKTVDQLLNTYAQQGALKADAQMGEALWSKGFKKNKDGSLRRCSTCHSKDLTRMGQHFRTGKDIQPMSPSVNPKRLSSQKKVKKWLKRNCKWTLGRECSVQEKANIIAYINASKNQTF